MGPIGSRVDFTLHQEAVVCTRGFRAVAIKAASSFTSAELGFSDFFEQLFGARSRGARGFGGYDFEEAPLQGQDVEADILVALEEALRGSTRQISFRRGASGKPQTYTVKIPKGVREGQRIRLAGLGEKGGRGGQAGDLYLRIKFEKHPDFEIRGSDLYYDLEIPVSKAVLGGEFEVSTVGWAGKTARTRLRAEWAEIPAIWPGPSAQRRRPRRLLCCPSTGPSS